MLKLSYVSHVRFSNIGPIGYWWRHLELTLIYRHVFLILRYTHGRRLRGELGGRSPPKFEVREVVLSDAYESKNWIKKVSSRNFLFWNRGFSREEKAKHVYVIYHISDSKNRQQQKQIGSMTKRIEFFYKKGHSKILVRESLFPFPQTRRQVSVYGYTYQPHHLYV